MPGTTNVLVAVVGALTSLVSSQSPTSAPTSSCYNPLTALNTSSGFAAKLDPDTSLETGNCSWNFGPRSNGYMSLYNIDGTVVWTSNSLQSSTGSGPYELELTVSGNLRLETGKSTVLWESDTSNDGERPYNLTIYQSGNVYLWDDIGSPIWSLFCEDNKPYFKSGNGIGDSTPIYSSQCEYFVQLSNYDIDVYSCQLSQSGEIQNDTVNKCSIMYTYTSENQVNTSLYLEPFYMDIDDDGALGVRDSNDDWLWTITYKYEDSGAVPYFFRINDKGKISVYDSLNTLMWDTDVEEPSYEPSTEIWEILVLSFYFGLLMIFLCMQLFRVAYLTRNSKNYSRDGEAGAMHYTKRSELRSQLADSMTLGGPTPGGGTLGGTTTGGGGDAVDALLLGPGQDDNKNNASDNNEEDDKKDDRKGDDNEDDDIETSDDEDDDDMTEEEKAQRKEARKKQKVGKQKNKWDTRARLDETYSSQKGFKFLSTDHFRRWFLIMSLFSDMIWVGTLHFLSNACSYALLVRWCLAIWGSNDWRPENLSDSEFHICTYILMGILGLYHINSAISLRNFYRDTFYGLANKEEITYVEKKTMSNVFYQQLWDLRILKEIRSSTLNEQESQFFKEIARCKYAISSVPQCILFLYFIMRVNDFAQSWLAIAALATTILYILTNNIQIDDEVFSRSASQKWPPTPGFIARLLFRLFEIISRISIFALAAVVIHWAGVIVLLCYHLLANFIFFQGSLLGKNGWNIIYFIITIGDLGLVSRRRELDSWLAKPKKYIVHFGRAMTCFVFSSSFDSMFHCVRLDEQLLFDFVFGRFIEQLSEIGLIYVLASWHEDGYLPPSDEQGTLLFISLLSSISVLLFFFILRLSKLFDQNRSSHRNALDLARDGRWDMLSDYIPLYTEQEINRMDRFGDRTNILIYSCEEAQTKIVMQLLDRECDVSVCDRRGNTALHKAAKNGRLDILEALISADADVNKANLRGWTPLHVACREKRSNCVKKLIEANASGLSTLYFENLTSIGVAMRFGSLEIVKYLLKEVLKMDDNRFSEAELLNAISYVEDCEDFGGPLVHALHYGELGLAKLLLECRVQNVNAQDHFGETALHKACSWGYDEIAKELIEKYKCDVNLVSDKGYSPFHIAVARQYPDIVDMLVKNDAEVDFPTIAFVEKVFLKTCKTGYFNIFKHLTQYEKEMNFDVRDLDGNSALLLAAQSKHYNICEYLIKHGCDVTLRNMWGKSIFDTSIPDNLREAVEFVLKVQGGMVAVHGQTPGMLAGSKYDIETPGLDNSQPRKLNNEFNDEDDEPGIVGLGNNQYKDDAIPESSGVLGWGPGGKPV